MLSPAKNRSATMPVGTAVPVKTGFPKHRPGVISTSCGSSVECRQGNTPVASPCTSLADAFERACERFAHHCLAVARNVDELCIPLHEEVDAVSKELLLDQRSPGRKAIHHDLECATYSLHADAMRPSHARK